MPKAMLGVIGGSGVYDLPGIEDVREARVATPWGEASDAIRVGRIGGREVAFLPRHGRGHRLSPTGINYRANIDAMKRLGVTDIVSLSAVGSFRQELAPGLFVFVDQYIDRTFKRETSFFGDGCVAHVSMAHPVSAPLVDRLAAAASEEKIDFVKGGALVVIEGPQFSSQGESLHYKAQGFSLIGMTAMPEAKLAREAEIAYATVAMVTDFDCWHPDHDAVDVKSVVAVMQDNTEKAKRLIARLARDFADEAEDCASRRALDFAIMTAPAARDPALLKKLDAVAGRVLKS